MTEPRIVVQIIECEWTKASRGGPGAAARNQVPEALPLAPARNSAVQHVRCVEADAFAARAAPPFALVVGRAGAELPGVSLKIDAENRLIAAFRWTVFGVGAPERAHSRTRLALAPGEWGRLRFNGRFGSSASDGREWTYRKFVYNVAYGVFAPDLFTATAPAHAADELADLL